MTFGGATGEMTGGLATGLPGDGKGDVIIGLVGTGGGETAYEGRGINGAGATVSTDTGADG